MCEDQLWYQLVNGQTSIGEEKKHGPVIDELSSSCTHDEPMKFSDVQDLHGCHGRRLCCRKRKIRETYSPSAIDKKFADIASKYREGKKRRKSKASKPKSRANTVKQWSEKKIRKRGRPRKTRGMTMTVFFDFFEF
ncbi:hypothetical protein AB6A40_010231 [Gnathostoma spinigerum]|uniref:Uncharacterized protein n=1 Tax=Gnathostoma spinigerum TaxID=75299 RepID=A0ABD6F233_9BILA